MFLIIQGVIMGTNFIIWGGIIGAIFGAILSATRPDKDIPIFVSTIGSGIIGAIIGLCIWTIIRTISFLGFFAAEGARALS